MTTATIERFRSYRMLEGNNVPTYPYCDGWVRTRKQGRDPWHRAGKDLKVPAYAVTVTGAWSAFEFAQMSREGILDLIDKYEAMTTAAASKILDEVAQIAKSQGETSIPQRALSRQPRTRATT